MPAYLERYLNGDREAVWRELMELGAAVREEPLYSDAMAVAGEVIRRVVANVEALRDYLLRHDYEFRSTSWPNKREAKRFCSDAIAPPRRIPTCDTATQWRP